MDSQERDRLHKELITLGDLIAQDDDFGTQRAEYNRQYKKVAKLLYPEMYQRKQRKPTQSIIRTLKSCDCGEPGWKFIRYTTGVQIVCKRCGRKSEIVKTNQKVRDSWNKTFNNK